MIFTVILSIALAVMTIVVIVMAVMIHDKNVSLKSPTTPKTMCDLAKEWNIGIALVRRNRTWWVYTTEDGALFNKVYENYSLYEVSALTALQTADSNLKKELKKAVLAKYGQNQKQDVI